MSDHDWAIRTWSPAPALVAVLWLGAAVAGVWCGLLVTAGADPAGRLLAGLAAVGLLGWAVFGSRARPRLQADAGGLTVGGLLCARHHPWPLVTGVRVARVRRWGRDSSLLEIETRTAEGDERLLVLGRLDLGADPEDVVDALLARRP